jgi:uncharacterized protein YndB with AHSA1/START domain
LAKRFEMKDEVTVEASPDDVWAAITDGRQVDSWFMGRSEIEPREGGKLRTDIDGFVMESTITAWEPGKRLAYRMAERPDGTLFAFEYTIEARGGGKTAIRLVHSGFFGGDDWEAEYDALTKGDPAYLRKLAQYVTHFRGQVSAKNIFVPFENAGEKAHAWAAFHRALGLNGQVAAGDRVNATLDGLPGIEGVVDFRNDDFLGVLTSDGLYRFIHGHDNSVVVEHHIFSDDVARRESPEAWQSWLGKVFAAPS